MIDKTEKPEKPEETGSSYHIIQVQRSLVVSQACLPSDDQGPEVRWSYLDLTVLDDKDDER